MNLKNNFDFHSIRFRLWGSFLGFALVLISLIWLLQIFFLNNYYEEMKTTETTKLANSIIEAFHDEDENIYHLSETLYAYASANEDVYIRVENDAGDVVFTNYSNHSPLFRYNLQLDALRAKLYTSPLGRVSMTTSGVVNNDGTKILGYACFLSGQTEKLYGLTPQFGNYVLYIFSPLYPVQSTVSILREQLIYITFIAIFMALTLALYMASRLSKPIKDITHSAAEMGKGNYGVTFQGGQYTEIIDLADTLTAASRELEKTDMYQKDLIANVSHDLRTPLTMIKSYAEMIRDLSGNNPQKREAHLSVIIDEADRLNALVTDMLNMSRMQSKTITIERKIFNIRETAASTLASYDILSEQEGYRFFFNCTSPIYVNGDEAKMKQVFANLITNAIKYCGKDKVVIINLKRIGKKVRCEIIDHGAGIAPDEINHVWEKYYKSSTHHVRPTEGSGLGLSIVREILILHKATYGVNSKLGKGSTFWFELDTVKAEKTFQTCKVGYLGKTKGEGPEAERP